MLRKLLLWAILLAIVGGVVYCWLHYVIIGFWDPESKRVTHMYVVPKPERGFEIYYDHIDRARTEKEIASLKERNEFLPWHMDRDYIMAHQVYDLVLDTRTKKSAE